MKKRPPAKDTYPNCLDHFIRQQGIAKASIAGSLHIGSTTLSLYLSGRRPVPQERRVAFAELLHLSVDVLFPPSPQELVPAESTRVRSKAPEQDADLVLPPSVMAGGNLLTGDVSIWFSQRLASIVSYITQWKHRASFSTFQTVLDRELRMFEMKDMFDNSEAYSVSRRGALLFLAALPTGLLALVSREQESFIGEEFLPPCAASITACWHLLNGREFASVEQSISVYLPHLAEWARRRGRYQTDAALLASQAQLLLGFVALHQLQFPQRIACCKEAVSYARIAKDHILLVKSLTQLGNALYDQQGYSEMLRVYQEAKSLLSSDVSTPFPKTLQSKVFMGLAHAYAQQGQADAALEAFRQAEALFPDDQEELPPYLSADEGHFSLILFKGWIYLDLERTAGRRAYAVNASQALAQIESLSKTMILPERIGLEITNRRAQAAIALRDMDTFQEHTRLGIEGLRLVQSEKRRQEIVLNYHAARQCWPKEECVRDLADALIAVQ